MKYQPAEIKTVLMKFSDALMAGRSETFKRGKTSNAERPTSNVQFQSRPGIACSSFDVGRWALDVGRFPDAACLGTHAAFPRAQILPPTREGSSLRFPARSSPLGCRVHPALWLDE